MSLPIRKIESPEESERKRKRNTLLLSIVMIAILLFSTAGYFSLQDGEDNNSGSTNEKVQNIGDSWILRYGDQTFRLANSPEEAENVSILAFLSLDRYYGKTVYVASESDSEFYELYSTLGVYTERMQQSCYGKCEKNLPEKDCNDTLIVIRELNETEGLKNNGGKIYEEDGCLFIEGGINAVDAFLYRVFGVN